MTDMKIWINTPEHEALNESKVEKANDQDTLVNYSISATWKRKGYPGCDYDDSKDDKIFFQESRYLMNEVWDVQFEVLSFEDSYLLTGYLQALP